MRAISSAVSITVHVAVGATVFLGASKTGRSDPVRPQQTTIVFQAAPSAPEGVGRGGFDVPVPFTIAVPDLGSIATPSTLPPTGATTPMFSPSASSGATGGQSSWSVLTETYAEMLTSPLPVYPDLLRQAGVQGRVVLEAIVDTTGRVLAPSILVVSATHPAFVAPARQALLASLFRPALAGGKPVRMRVRIPYDFTIRSGMGRAR